jgi:dTDP-4-amino-4,6-dideoxygalactose transaminase
MNVPFFNLARQFEKIRKEITMSLEEVFQTQQFILGPQVAELEAMIARYCDVPFAIGVASGSDALFLALLALGIGPGDEVILPSFTFFATAGAVSRTGAKPVFADIDPATYNIDPEEVKKRVSSQTKAIIPVHLYGQCADMDPILELCTIRSIFVIEDAAQALGAAYQPEGASSPRKAGQMGILGCFSFFPTKNLGAFGDAGMIVTDRSELAERLRILRVHGSHPKYYHKWIGINSRLDTIQAAILKAKLPHLESWTEERRRKAKRYEELLGNLFSSLPGAALPKTQYRNRHIYNQYVIRVPQRDQLKAFLHEQGVGTEIYYPVPLHLQQCYAFLDYREGDFPHSEKAAKEVLALPIYPELTDEEQDYVVDQIRRFYKK